MMPRVVSVSAACLVASAVCGCTESQRSDATQLANPCEMPVARGSAVRVTGAAIGRVREIYELSARLGATRVGIVTDDALYHGTLGGDSVAVEHMVAAFGEADGQIRRIDALTSSGDGSVTVFDFATRRITHWGPSGVFDQSVTLPFYALEDAYAGGAGAIVAVSAHSGDKPYAPTIGELRSLDSLGFADSILASFPSLVVQLTGWPRGRKYLRRPLEHQPIIRWSWVHGWVIASTDSLNIHFGTAHQQRVIAGKGVRAPIDRAARDSSIEAYVRTTGASRDPERAEKTRAFARENLFQGRTRLQLIDDIIVLFDGSFAVRRMHLCRDRHGWNVVDSLGRPGGGFTVPLAYRAVMPVNDGMLFAAERGDSLKLMVVRVSLD